MQHRTIAQISRGMKGFKKKKKGKPVLLQKWENQQTREKITLCITLSDFTRS